MFKKKTTTINFEGNQIRFLVLKGDNIEAMQTRKIPPEFMAQGQILNPGTIGNVISATLKKIKGSRRRVITSITSQRSVHRIMRIPLIEEKLLEETIRRKAKQEFAIPIDESDVYWRVLARKDNQIHLYVLAVPSLIIDSQVEALKAARIKPKLMDIKPLALQRLVNKPTCIIVNLESYSLGVYIIINHIPILVRTVPLDSGNLTAEAKLDLLSQELARTVKYYNESNKTNRLPAETEIFLSGELFDVSQLDTRLEEGSDLAARLQTRTPYQIKIPAVPFEAPDQFSRLTYAVNLGLALKNK